MDNLKSNIKYNRTMVKFALLYIGIMNIVFIFLQSPVRYSIMTIILHSILMVLLFKGSNIVRIFFIASTVEEIIVLSRVYIISMDVEYFNLFIYNLYFITLSVYCISTIYLLVFNKYIKLYFEEQKYDEAFICKFKK